MHLVGKYFNTTRTLSGDMVVSFIVDSFDVSKFDDLVNSELTIDVEKYWSKKSLNANRYFWKLCTLIAEAIGSDKDSVYIMQLKKYGTYIDIEVIDEAVEALARNFRYVELLDDGYADKHTARCYWGSSHYDSKEMSVLINGTVIDAKELNIPTWDKADVDRLIKEWRG